MNPASNHSVEKSTLCAWAGAHLLTLFVLAAYSRVHQAGFIWDDESHLTQNPCVVGPLGLRDIWTSAHAVYYPLVLTTFWVLHKFVALNPLPYHLLNLGWHVASTLLLWRVLVQLRVRGAWLGSAIWALHPVMVQSVAWVTEMKNTQSAFFYLLTISLFLQSRNSRYHVTFYVCSIFSFAAAITSKPSTVMLPAVLLLCLWWRKVNPKRRDLISSLPFLFISLVASAWTIWEQKFHSGARGVEWAQTPLQRVLISADAIWFYFIKLLWPHPLIFIYPRWTIDPSQWLNYLPLFGLGLAGTILFMRRNRELRPVYFALSYFVICLFPVLAFFDVYFFRYSSVSDHFQYLASMGPLALGGAVLSSLAEELIKPPLVKWALATALLTILGTLTFHQTADYRDLITLYEKTLAQNPRCWMADYNLGLELKNRGELDAAIAHYRHAIENNPNYVEANYNLGGALIEKGAIDEAIQHYHRAIELKPDDADSHNNYGSALRQLGRSEEAEAEYRRALSLQPDYLDARINLGSLLLQLGRTDQAMAQLHQAVQLQPNNPATHRNLGHALMKTGHAGEAEVQFQRALELAPDDVGALNSLAWLLATSRDDALRDGAKAVTLAERADRIRRSADPIILHSLAAACAEAGRFNDAIATAQRALYLAEEQNNRALVAALQSELSLYQLRLPYRQNASGDR
jgi:protein O-mannosyl-transferase